MKEIHRCCTCGQRVSVYSSGQGPATTNSYIGEERRLTAGEIIGLIDKIYINSPDKELSEYGLGANVALECLRNDLNRMKKLDKPEHNSRSEMRRLEHMKNTGNAGEDLK